MTVREELAAFNAAYPWQDFTCKAGCLPYRWHPGGETTLVLLTGGIGKSDLFYKHFYAFAGLGYSVLSFDYDYSLRSNTALADAIAALLGRLGAKNVYLVGQSYGGLLAQVVARRHPARVRGLVLSNTGTLFAGMPQEGVDAMMAMKTRMDKMVRTLYFVPMALVKPSIRGGVMRNAQNAGPEEQQFMKEICDVMLKLLTAKHERHMCRLMADLLNEFDMRPEDFAGCRGRVLLLLSEDDKTFNASVKQALIENMPQPEVNTQITGGHLALLLRIDPYVQAVHGFIQNKEHYEDTQNEGN